MKRLFAIGLLLLALVAGYAYMALFRPYQGFSSEGVYVEIPRGTSLRTIARLLADHGVIRDRFAFEAYGRWRQGQTLQAGEYFFDHPVTSLEAHETLAKGRVFTRPFVVPEGYTMFGIAELAQRMGLVTREDFLASARDPFLIRDLAPGARTLEGFLFPATYEFPRHMTGKDMTEAMVGRFRQVWATLPPPGSRSQERTVSEIVTLASLVERETPREEERPRVAGVFTNRLQIGLPLQCDPTVIYALEIAGRYNGSLTTRDLRFPSPYNTYEHAGLPPGPIANPGEAALRAALNPPPTQDLYFVANTEGGHFFGRTIQEHNRNVQRYRQLLRSGSEQGKIGKSPAASVVPSGQAAPGKLISPRFP